MKVRRWLVLLLLGLGLLSIFQFLLASNYFDWDSFFAAQEVDYRSWWHDGTPPLWSYQMCAGSTRIGDPQALGLSPLFLLVLLAGPLWGTKLIVYLGLLLGFFFTYKLLSLLVYGPSPTPENQPDTLPLWVVSWLVWSSNYFLWHFHVGHVTFSLMGLALGIAYFTFRAWWGGLSWGSWTLAALLTWTYYAGGFAQTTIYLLTPLFLTIGLTILWQLGVRWRRKEPLWPWLQAIGRMFSFHLAGMGLAFYKLYFMVSYQRTYPRTLPPASETESILDILTHQLLPTWNHLVLGMWRPAHGKYGIWEYSLFNLLVWLLLLYVGFRLIRKNNTTETPQTTPPAPQLSSQCPGRSVFLILYPVMLLGFVFGDLGPGTLHTLLNKLLFQGSVRVIQRYQIGFVFIAAFWLSYLLAQRGDFRAFFARFVAIPVMLLSIANLLTFQQSLSWKEWTTLTGYQAKRRAEMKWMLLVPHRSNIYPPTHKAIRRDMGVINCYNPLRMERKAFFRELPHTRQVKGYLEITRFAQPRLVPLSLIDQRSTPVPKACQQGSYFRQHKVVLDPSCPHKVCLNIRQPNLYHPHPFRFFPQYGKYCRGQ